MQYPPIICSGGLMMKIWGRKHTCKGIVDICGYALHNSIQYIYIYINNDINHQ